MGLSGLSWGHVKPEMPIRHSKVMRVAGPEFRREVHRDWSYKLCKLYSSPLE